MSKTYTQDKSAILEEKPSKIGIKSIATIKIPLKCYKNQDLKALCGLIEYAFLTQSLVSFDYTWCQLSSYLGSLTSDAIRSENIFVCFLTLLFPILILFHKYLLT